MLKTNEAGRGILFFFYWAKSVYKAHFAASVMCSTACTIWKAWAPLKCKLFLWLVVRGRVWTADCLAKRDLPHNAACCFCNIAQESAHHLFMGCSVVTIIWSSVLLWANLSEAIPQNAPEFRDWWQEARNRVHESRRNSLNTMVPLIIWSIWRENES